MKETGRAVFEDDRFEENILDAGVSSRQRIAKDGFEFEADLRSGVRSELQEIGIPLHPNAEKIDDSIGIAFYPDDEKIDDSDFLDFAKVIIPSQHVEKQIRLQEWRERKEKTERYERHQAATLGQREAVLLVDSAIVYARELKKNKSAELLGALQLEGERRWLNVAQPDWISTWDQWHCFLWALEFLPEEVEWSYWNAQLPASDPDPRVELLANFADRWAYEVVADRCVYYDRAVERRYDDHVTFVLRYRHFDYDFWSPRKPIPAHHYPMVCHVCGGGFFPFRNKKLCHECASRDSWMSEMFETRAKRLGMSLDGLVAKKSGGTSAFDSRRLDALAEVVAQTRDFGATVRQVAAVLKCSTGRVSKLELRAKVNARAEGWEETR